MNFSKGSFFIDFNRIWKFNVEFGIFDLCWRDEKNT